MEIKQDCCKGTKILFSESAKIKRDLLNNMINIVETYGFQEMMIPILQKQEVFSSKVGDENQKMMYAFKDKGERDLCLAPEYTAVVQRLSSSVFKFNKDVKLFYIGECFRGENTALGRWRQFTQFGIEILNPTKDYSNDICEITKKLVELVTTNYTIIDKPERGLEYYNGYTMEISCPEINNLSVCGGGSYEGGIGAAIGVDRLLLLCK